MGRRGNDGSGWSMAVEPRRAPADGQDQKYLPPGSPIKKRPASQSRPTLFELSIADYLKAHATAIQKGTALPEIPSLITERYKGKTLTSWKKTIFKTKLYKRICDDALNVELSDTAG